MRKLADRIYENKGSMCDHACAFDNDAADHRLCLRYIERKPSAS